MDQALSLIILDKNKEHLRALLEFLNATEIQVYSLNSIEELFDKACAIGPSAIICDHKNIDTELAQTLMKLKGEEKTKYTPFFVLGTKIPKPLANQYSIRGAEVVSQDLTPLELLSTIFPEYLATLTSIAENAKLEEIKSTIGSIQSLELLVNSDNWDLLRTWSSEEMYRIKGGILIVNLLECDFVNSEGIGTLITLLHECRNYDVQYYIMSADDHFKNTIGQTGLLEIFTIVSDHQELKKLATK
ncbi:MAG: STAS domain-containing protein [Fibrobacterales bacterium]